MAAPCLEDESRLFECGFREEEGEEEAAVRDGVWSNCLTLSLIKPGRVEIELDLEAGVGIEVTGFDTER